MRKTSGAGAYRHGDLRNALIHSAATSLCTQELRELSLRELAKELGVSTAAPYSHFTDKEDLLNAVASEGFRLLRDRVTDAIAPVRTGRGQLVAFITAYLRFSRDEPGYYKVMFQSPASQTHQDGNGNGFADQALEVLLAVIRAATPKKLTPQIARERAIMLCSVMHGLISLDNAGPFRKLPGPEALDKLAIEAGLRLVEAASV